MVSSVSPSTSSAANNRRSSSNAAVVDASATRGDLMEAVVSQSPSLGNVLTSCLDMLKIEDAAIRKKAVEFVGSVSVGTTNAYGKWITATKAIADACAATGRVFSQSEVCDFLTVAAKGVDVKRAGSKAVNDATFQIYVDIMENYQKAGDKLRLHYPRIIIDTIAALDRGVDTRGESVGVYGIERYYQQRKQTAPGEDPAASYSFKPISEAATARSPSAAKAAGSAASTASAATAAVMQSYSAEFVESLSQITGRSKKEVERSLSGLTAADAKKLGDLASNHKRLQKYSNRLSSPEAFKKEVEKDLGRKLTENQLQHALNSVRKSKTYVENILDGKFVPHGTHGINHVKHNLEYGYQLMGLIAPRKRRSPSS